LRSFNSFLAEETNAHMEHIEDNVLNLGVDGARQSINFLRSLRDMLAGNASSGVNVTVKWDGAPAVFAGIDPEDGKFFVAKKSIFNATPKVYKTVDEVKADTSGDLQAKMLAALEHFPKLGIKGIIQGDFLYAKEDLETTTIDGETYLTFHPNTILYAVPTDSDLARKIRGSKIGVVWHTSYEGDSLSTIKAKFGVSIAPGLKQHRDVWFDDADFKDVTGKATFTEKETNEVTRHLSMAGKTLRQVPSAALKDLSENDELLTRVKAHFNSKIKARQKIVNPQAHVKDLADYVYNYYNTKAQKLKTERGRTKANEKTKLMMKFFQKYDARSLANIFELMNHIIAAKEKIISKLNSVDGMRTFLRTANGFKVTGQEGFVAIDHLGKNTLKLVDRIEFSYANFSSEIVKGWQR